MACSLASPRFCTTSCPYPRCLEEEHKGHGVTRLHLVYRSRAVKIAADWDSGLRNISELARAYGVARSTIRKAVRRYSVASDCLAAPVAAILACPLDKSANLVYGIH